ncbi:hypothetical protein ANOM_000711 [Aspergillus nomiae NRRL 13137]|uniref:Cupin 2 conserved barrel domain-containing protein n=1 Tax=Aspergillus nomiae NRRL (strain ATCC 15546 / NRRL 13137 / CBS 260.88 / M93) TaxID=1509407 RepID=A0A0L1JHW7_ASPN3|nr:uncharacterized protein ANOM_000711 [Aspergillus nomiae NRRL 13137]KNG90963.1 hypothetical protein ANOM_000711 [Aspergillus nomiae NRRL 13137]
MPEPTVPSLPPPRRVVTGHNTNGQATVAFDSHLTPQSVGDGTNLTILWSTSEHPANVSGPEDAAPSAPSWPPKGSGITAYDIPPKTEGVFHRSITLDYVIVGKGSVVLGLEDGSKVTLNEGDMVVQRATMHGWSNTTEQWARLYSMMVPAQAPIVNGEELKEDWPF